MKYKLLVLDIDGTLTNNRKEITPYTRKVLIEAQNAGLKIILASGRPTFGIVPLAKELKMEQFGGYILSYNGGKIIDFETMQPLYEQVLPLELVPHLHGAAIESRTTILTYLNEYIITENPEDQYVQHEVMLTKMQAKRVSNFIGSVDFAPDKCLIVGEAERLIPLAEQLNTKFGDQLNAFRSEPFFLEVVPKGIDKAESLKRLLAITGHSTDEMIAIGDGYNDISMIKLAGLGIAMANGQEEVKAIADQITLSNEEDGVAVALLKEMNFCS